MSRAMYSYWSFGIYNTWDLVVTNTVMDAEYGGRNPAWLVQPLAQAGLISGSALLSNDFADSNFVQKVTFVKNEALLATEDQLSDLLQQLPTSVGASYTWNVR